MNNAITIYSNLTDNYENLNYTFDQYEFIIENSAFNSIVNYHVDNIALYVQINRLFELDIKPKRNYINLKKAIGLIFVSSETFIHELINYKLVIADALKNAVNQQKASIITTSCFSYFSNFYDLYNLKNEIIYNISVSKIESNDGFYEHDIFPFKIVNNQMITPFDIVVSYANDHRDNFFSKSFRSKFKKLSQSKNNRFLVEKIASEFMKLDLDNRTRIIYLFDYLNRLKYLNLLEF